MGMSIEARASQYKRALQRRKKKFYRVAEMFGYRSLTSADIVSDTEFFSLDFIHAMRLIGNKTSTTETRIQRLRFAKEPIRDSETDPEVHFHEVDLPGSEFESSVRLSLLLLSDSSSEGEGYSLECEIRFFVRISQETKGHD